MSRAKLFNMIKSRGEKPNPRNPFDLTNRHVYTQKVAKIMPVKAFHTIPDDYLEVSMTEFSQNNIPMNTAAFLSGKKELLAYFVPYNSVWHNYNQYQATREDPDSSALQAKGISFEPRFSLNRLYHTALYFTIGAWMYESMSKLWALQRWYSTFRNSSSSSAWTDFANEYMTGDNRASISELVEFMKKSHYVSSSIDDYEYFCRAAAKEISEWSFINFPFPFYETFDCFENAVEHRSDLTYGYTILNMFGTPIWTDWIMKLDMLRYGNIYPILRNLRVELDKVVDDVLTGDSFLTSSGFFYSEGIVFDRFLQSVSSDDPDEIKEYYGDSYYRAVEKIDSISTVNDSGDDTQDEYVNVYPLYSYNKCFYSYLRNVYFDTDYSVYNYNCDFVDCRDWESSIIRPGMIPCRFYHLESHQWKKDMFTGVLPANQLGQVSQVVINVAGDGSEIEDSDGPIYPDLSLNSKVASPSLGERNLLVNRNLSLAAGGSDQLVSSFEYSQLRTPHYHTVNSEDIAGRLSSRFNVLSLKRAEALQQYAQDLMRAGNRTQDVFNQVYGVSPKSEMDETPYFIDVASSDLSINPIVSTASTGQENNGRLGDIAARALIDGRNKPLNFKFSTKDFGVVLFLSYILPDSMYNSYNLDPCITHLDPESHFIPYFQNLGLQAVLGSYLNNLKPVAVRSRSCGYAPPYIERKTDIDLVHGNLVDTYLPKVSETDSDAYYQGELSHWVVARTDMQQEDTVSLRNFYVDPRIVDNVFQFNADSDLSTDHFLTYAKIEINSVRAISEIGLPRF